MTNRGVNPFVVSYGGNTQFEIRNLDYLSNLPTKKSVYFTIRPPHDEFKCKLPDAWFYETGVFDGKFVSKIGQGAAGTVISGEWFGKKAAFKFVDIGAQKFQADSGDALKALNEKLLEMISIQSIKGSKIVSLYGHYR